MGGPMKVLVTLLAVGIIIVYLNVYHMRRSFAAAETSWQWDQHHVGPVNYHFDEDGRLVLWLIEDEEVNPKAPIKKTAAARDAMVMPYDMCLNGEVDDAALCAYGDPGPGEWH
jgi:hypothetical protein